MGNVSVPVSIFCNPIWTLKRFIGISYQLQILRWTNVLLIVHLRVTSIHRVTVTSYGKYSGLEYASEIHQCKSLQVMLWLRVKVRHEACITQT